MAQNAIDKNRAALIALATKMKMGLGTLGALLGITQMTAVTFGAVLSAFTAALGYYNQARGLEQAAYNVYHANLAAIEAWLKVVRGVLVGYYGNTYNMNWASAGFVQPSTAIPRKIKDQVALVGKLQTFFTANPGKEVSDLNATASQATALLEALDDAEDPLLQAQTATRANLILLVTAETALSGKMRMLIGILKDLLSPSDPRWETFGLNIPATPTTPGIPQHVTLTQSGSTVLAQWEAVALATRYRVRMMIVGVDTKYRLVASGTEPMALIPDLLPGATVMVFVQAVNGSAQGKASEPVIYTVPVTATETVEPVAAPEPAKAAVAPVAELSLPVVTLPNGKRNGNGNGTHAVSRMA
jgi:hypothetical protein